MSKLGFGDCLFKAEVVTDKVVTQKWESCSTNFSQTWSEAQRHVQEPAHKYIEKHHLTALYMYTSLLQPVNHASSAKQKKAFGSCSLYLLLSEAIQILKHSQVTCLNTYYRTETLEHHLNISNKQVHFNTFILGSDQKNFTGIASCFQVYSCFGANVTHYSALKQNNQVLIPPYEVFKVTDIQTETKGCKVLYRLRSNLDCVYDQERDVLHPISAAPVGGFWITLTIACVVIISVLLPFVIVRVRHKRTALFYGASSLHNSPEIALRPALG
ncbi:ecto-ADP-ribosyltransferase 4-like [Acanthochromis polyacanthus]|uniref:ecto-ADP-ribosyltransferase 4-like n=1 Tax=Acanthochromis polyacanthus TaxID=80966 RepID=UPI002233E565|nr:ecto-ADP-ribosyltransferase 4-like [Acanthochromis polyacanthus]